MNPSILQGSAQYHILQEAVHTSLWVKKLLPQTPNVYVYLCFPFFLVVLL